MNEQKLSYRIFDVSDPKAVVFTVHGMQEHKERYEALASCLNKHQIACINYDLPGHGETAGNEENKGWFGENNGWKALVDSAADIALIARKKYPDVPVVYFGHSMGTMVGRVFLQNYDLLIDAMILSGAPNYNPGCRVGLAVADAEAKRKGKRGHSKLLDKLATGSFNQGIKDPRTELDWLSYNTDNVDKYIADEWCGFPFTIQGYHDLFTLMVKMNDTSLYRCMNPDIPILFFAGEDDPCTGGEKGLKKSIRTLKDAGYDKIDTKIWPHMRHETMHEDDAPAVMEYAAEWITKNV